MTDSCCDHDSASQAAIGSKRYRRVLWPALAINLSAKGLAAQRRRLALSAHDCGLLVGASGQSVYNWEDGKAHPRAKQLPAIAALKTMGKKEAAARLASLREPT